MDHWMQMRLHRGVYTSQSWFVSWHMTYANPVCQLLHSPTDKAFGHRNVWPSRRGAKRTFASHDARAAPLDVPAARQLRKFFTTSLRDCNS
jgi:hypothetical protein